MCTRENEKTFFKNRKVKEDIGKLSIGYPEK